MLSLTAARSKCISMVCSTNVLCPQNMFSIKITNIQRSYVPLCGHMTFVLLTPARTMTIIIDKITIFFNDVNETSTPVELLAINILCYGTCHKEVT